MNVNTFTIGRSNVVHASIDTEARHANTFCGAEAHNGPRRYVSAAPGREVTCKTCIKRLPATEATVAAVTALKSATVPATAPEPFASPIGPLTAFAAVMAATRAANARVFG